MFLRWIALSLIGMLLSTVSAGDKESAHANEDMRSVPVELFRIDGLSRFRKMTPAQAETRVSIARDNDNVYVSVDCREPLSVRNKIKDNGYAVWKCDNIEFFFGGIIKIERKGEGEELQVRLFDKTGAEFRKSPLRIPKHKNIR